MTKKIPVLFLIFLLLAFCGCQPGRRHDGRAPGTGISREIQDKIMAHNQKGMKLMMEGKHLEAAREFDQALKLDDRNVAALEGKGEALLHLKKYEEARHVLDKLLSIDPEHAKGLLLRSAVNFSLGRKDLYLQDAQKAQKMSPFTVLSNVSLARAYNDNRQFGEALKVLEKTGTLNPDEDQKLEILIAKAHAYDGLRDLKKCAQIYDEVINTAKGSKSRRAKEFLIVSYNYSVTNYSELGEHEKALKALESLREMDPELKELRAKVGDKYIAELYQNLAYTYFHKSQPGKAMEYSAKSSQLDPKYPRAVLERAVMLMYAGNVAEARTEAKKWSDMSPPTPQTAEDCADYAVAYALARDGEKAKKMIETAMSREPANHRHFIYKAAMEMSLGNRDIAKADYKKFLDKATDDEKKFAQIMFDRLNKNL